MCSISEILLNVHPNASVKELNSIIWTRSAVDMADAVITGIASKAITIFEGSPGRGKTVVAKAVLESLGMRCTRINLSPTSSIEDLFGRDMPIALLEGGFTTQFMDGPLAQLREEYSFIHQQHHLA